MRTSAFAGVCLILPLISLGTILAADGAIPIWEPTTITEPGSYVLTRNITGSGGGTAVRIEADDVDLDLAGFTIEWNTYTIIVEGDRVTIHDGVVNNNDEAAVGVTGDNFVIRRLTLATGDDEVLYARGNNGMIEDVVVGPGYFGPGIAVVGSGNTIRGNVIRNADSGIRMYGDGNRIADNTISSCHLGIELTGSLNIIEGNLITNSASYGIRVRSESTGNVYRGNTARGNSGGGCTGVSSGGDFCDEGTNNTSHGDNYMPGQM